MPGRPSRRSRSLRPTLRGWTCLVVSALLLLLGYSLGFEELLVVASLALALPVIAVIHARLRRPKLSVTRTFDPDVVAAGRTTRVTLAVRNLGGAPTTTADVNDVLPWWEPASPQPLPTLMPRGAALSGGMPAQRGAILRYELHPQRRGLYRVGPLAVEHADPFGMARSVMTVGQSDELVVVPDLVELPQGSLTVADGEGSSLLVHRRVTGNDDDLTTREYRRGDAMRRVHWRASARHGELMVRQEEQRSHPEARILVDTTVTGYADVDRPVHDDPGVPTEQSESFEWVVRMLASLGVHLTEAGFDLTVAETAPSQVEPIGPRADGGRRDDDFLRSLAGIRLVHRHAGARPPVPEGAQTGSVFALLSEPDDATLGWVSRQRRPGEAAVAFVVASPELLRTAPGMATAVERTLHDTGWLVVRVDVDDDPADAWRAAHQGWGSIRGAR